MKKINLFLLTICFALCQLSSYADWNDTKHMFKYKKDIDATMDVLDTRNMATVFYHDTLFNFVNFHDNSDYHDIIVRKIYKTGTMYNPTWHYEKYDRKPNLGFLYGTDWQPAPVVFNDQLILFVIRTTDPWPDPDPAAGWLAFTIYNPNHNSWSGSIAPNVPNLGGSKMHGMAAVVLDGKLCLVCHKTNETIKVLWTDDINGQWNIFDTGLSNIAYGSEDDDQISAITASYTDTDRKRKSKMVIAYINSTKHPQYAEFKFTGPNTLALIKSDKIIDESDDEYQSVALAEGTISCPAHCPDGCEPDNTSTGDCIQAFMTKDVADNGYCRMRRIKRFQLKDGVWHKIENNVTTQTSPKHLWASNNVPLTTCVFTEPMAADTTIRQFICVVYRGMDEVDYPLNLIWAETNKLIPMPTKTVSTNLSGPEYTQYIGYIEGSPPFHTNQFDTAYVNLKSQPISDAEFSTTTSTKNEMSVDFEVKSECTFGMGVEAGISHAISKARDKENSFSIKHMFSLEAGKERVGAYLVAKPRVSRAFYQERDVYNGLLDTVYYFYMSEPYMDIPPLPPLQGSLDPGHPETYFNRGTFLDQYLPYAFGSTSVLFQGPATLGSVLTASESTSETNTKSTTVSVKTEFGEVFSMGVDATLAYTLKATTSTENEIAVSSLLRDATRSGDITRLYYIAYWLKPVVGLPNWWLHPGAEDQQTWCLTYDVDTIHYFNGDRLEAPPHGNIVINTGQTGTGASSTGGTNNLPGSSSGQPSNTVFSLGQNFPNPFSSGTRINFRIGNASGATGSDSPAVPTKLVVYDLMGKPVVTLVNELKKPGSYVADVKASQLPAGVYYYKLTAGDYSAGKRMVVIR